MPSDTEKPVLDRKLQILELFVGTITDDSAEQGDLYATLLGRIVVRNTITALYATYVEYVQGDLEAKTGFDRHQFDLLFHNNKEKLGDLESIMKLMVTGDPKGTIPSGPVNFFPTGFWQLPEVKWELINQISNLHTALLSAVCESHYELPADWQEEGHPEGLYIPLEDQVKNLSDALTKRLGKIQTKESEAETEVEEEVPETDGELPEAEDEAKD